jgi:membrane protein DedA with SNARE-associated domain
LLEELAKSLVSFTNELGYIGIYIYMTIVGTFIPLPSQIVLIPAGYLASKGQMSFLYVLISATLGSTSGATINYFLANTILTKVLKNKKKFIEKLTTFFYHHGKISIFLAPLTIGAGQYISIPAGIAKMDIKTFLPITFLGNSIFNFFMILIGYAFNPNEANQKAVYVSLGLLGFVIIIATLYILKETKKSK